MKASVSYTNTAAKIQWSPSMIEKVKKDKMFIQTNKNYKTFGIGLKQNGPILDISIIYVSK